MYSLLSLERGYVGEGQPIRKRELTTLFFATPIDSCSYILTNADNLMLLLFTWRPASLDPTLAPQELR